MEEIKKIKADFQQCGILFDKMDETYIFEPITKGYTSYILRMLVLLPALIVVLFVTGLSFIGIGILGLALITFGSGYRSYKDVLRYNQSRLVINKEKIESFSFSSEPSDLLKFSSSRNSNQVFPNSKILATTSNIGKTIVLVLTQKQSKYLNEDRFKIVKTLNHILADVQQE